MIRQSNNYSANQLIKTLGGPEKVQEILEKNYGMILTETKVMEYIPAGKLDITVSITFMNQSDISRSAEGCSNNQIV